ncbi:MAG: carbohydrate kinase family protein [Nitratireductor sp.]
MSVRSGIICAGNWIVDIVHDIPAWPAKSDLVVISNECVGMGGGAANVAFNLAALQTGYCVLPMGALGQDEHGSSAIKACVDVGLPTHGLLQLEGISTAHTHVMNVPGDSRTFFYCAGANQHFGPATVSINALYKQTPRIFYLGYLNLLPQLDEVHADGRTGAANLLGQASALGMETCVDLVSSHSKDYAQTVFATLPEVDWLFLNEVEAARATNIEIVGETDRENMKSSAEKLLQGGLRKGCILHTPQLTLWKTHDEELWFGVEQIPNSKIISAVGAGDAFAAGVLHGLHENWSPKDSVELGNKMAAACLRAPTATGGTPKLSQL